MQACWDISLKNATHKNFTALKKSRKFISDRISGVKRRLLPGLIVPVVKYALYFGVVDGKPFLPANVCFFFNAIMKFAEEQRSILWNQGEHFFSPLRSIHASIYSAAFQAKHYDVKMLCSQNKMMFLLLRSGPRPLVARAGAPFFHIYCDSRAKMSCETFSSGDKKRWIGVGSYHPDPEKSCKSQRGGGGSGVGGVAPI